MMRAAWYEKRGPARDVLVVGEMATPDPAPGEVRVRVHASGLNPTDLKARAGWGPNKAMAFPRVVPHMDGAGVIDAVGEGVESARIGERVWMFESAYKRPFGTAAQYSIIPAANAIPLPPQATFAEGAAVPIPGMTAHRCLFVDGPITDQLILVTGGAGAVGNATIQLAKWRGAKVITTISRPEQAIVASQAGADFVINYRTEDVAARVLEIAGKLGAAGVDRVVDVDFAKNIETSLAVLKPNGVISTYAAGDMGTEARFPFYPAMFKGITMQFVLVYVMSPEAHKLAAKDINAALEASAYRSHIGRRYPLEQIADAHEELESGKMVGKIVIDIE